jgi:hypothetical protein
MNYDLFVAVNLLRNALEFGDLNFAMRIDSDVTLADQVDDFIKRVTAEGKVPPRRKRKED